MKLLADQTLDELILEQQMAFKALESALARHKASSQAISNARCQLVETEAKIRQLKWDSFQFYPLKA